MIAILLAIPLLMPPEQPAPRVTYDQFGNYQLDGRTWYETTSATTRTSPGERPPARDWHWRRTYVSPAMADPSIRTRRK